MKVENDDVIIIWPWVTMIRPWGAEDHSQNICATKKELGQDLN